ncbi:MAG: hypothetical protein Q9196_002185 [Gyalolechia fulgens]
MKLCESDEGNVIVKRASEHKHTVNNQSMADQIPQFIQKSYTDPSFFQAIYSRSIIRVARKRHRCHGYGRLSADVILNITRYMNRRDLKNLLRVNKDFAQLGMSCTATIHIGIQREQYPEYYELFGTINRQTPDQEYHSMIEKENREWWEWRVDETFRMSDGCSTEREHHEFRPGEAGRVDLYATLAGDIEKAKIALRGEKISFSLRSEDVTRKALMLFWKMQWNDRYGLEHLCERTETEEHYVHVRQNLFLAEKPAVKARFIKILKPVARRVWKRLEFRVYTKAWSMTNRRLLRNEQHISVGALDTWVRDLAAELTIEAISKIGIVRALQLECAQVSDWDTAWIHEAIVDRLEELLDETVTVLQIGAPNEVFQFGRALGLAPEDVVDNGKPMFSDLLWLA